ncbi:MAG TPA: hypothetical protein VMZ26_17705 [Pyrinomonadaceae bacterium]|nr:hypothetical protein [Pyrinomonadaceae bacterium]
MQLKKIMALLPIIVAPSLFAIGCAPSESTDQPANSSSSAVQLAVDDAAANKDGSLAFDFSNFVYPKTKQWESFSLKNGESAYSEQQMGYGLADVVFGEIEGLPDAAVVVISVQTGGSATPNLVYLFDMHGNKPSVVWSMVSGDRADGGLRRAFLSDRQLRVELYEPENSKGDGCPKTYKRQMFALRKGKISLIREERHIPISEASGSFNSRAQLKLGEMPSEKDTDF